MSGGERTTGSAATRVGTDSRGGFTVFETLIASAITVVIFAMVAQSVYSWSRILKRTAVQTQLQQMGNIAGERIVRAMRSEMLSISLIATNATVLGATTYDTLFLFSADYDADNVVDGIKGWGLTEQDNDGDGSQDSVDTDGDEVNDTLLWTLIETSSTSLVVTSGIDWVEETLCDHVVLPWTPPDGSNTYYLFEFTGTDTNLDLNSNGIVSQTEIGSFESADGSINSSNEYLKVMEIGLGLKMLKRSIPGKVENLIVFEGVVKPRNWRAVL